jgi:predicted GIY-YIG superfamily endonuclease
MKKPEPFKTAMGIATVEISKDYFTYWYLYVLRLEENKYYIGITTDIKRRLEEHLKHPSKGSKWTRKYKPIKIIQIKRLGTMYQSEACTYEDYATYMYVKKYGIENVRGGSFCTVKLTYEREQRVFKRFEKKFDSSPQWEPKQ